MLYEVITKKEFHFQEKFRNFPEEKNLRIELFSCIQFSCLTGNVE